MKTSAILVSLLSFSTLSAAWPWPETVDIVKAAEGVERMLMRRDGSSSASQASSTGSNTNTASSASDKATSTSNTGKTTATNTKSNTDTKSGSSTGSNSGSSASGTITSESSFPTGTAGNSSATTQYDARLPAGGVSMITPAPLSGSQYYMIGDWLTFAWNYTSLSATPTAIDVLASCSAAQQTYTIAMNQSVGDTNTVLWDTGSYQQTAAAQLLTNQYTLIIYDAGSSISATAKPAYLAVQSTFVFGMYAGQSYTPWSSYNCATCNSAMSSMERQTWGFLLGMAAITIASFTWFATGVFGVI